MVCGFALDYIFEIRTNSASRMHHAKDGLNLTQSV